MLNVPPWSAWILLSCKNLKKRWDQPFWWKLVVQNDLKKCKTMFCSFLQMRQACCPVEHARMQVGNAVGSQTPVNKHQSTTVNQPSHSPHLFPASPPSHHPHPPPLPHHPPPITPPPPTPPNLPFSPHHTHTPFALTKREHSKTQLLLVSRRIGSSVRVRIMLGSNPEHTTAKAYSHYYINHPSRHYVQIKQTHRIFRLGRCARKLTGISWRRFTPKSLQK